MRKNGMLDLHRLMKDAEENVEMTGEGFLRWRTLTDSYRIIVVEDKDRA